MSEREQETVHEEEIFVKALFFDIDGTLLSEITKEIPQSALDALKKTAEKGNLTFINTGRTWSELPEELKKLPFSGFLCGCGTYLRRKLRENVSNPFPTNPFNHSSATGPGTQVPILICFILFSSCSVTCTLGEHVQLVSIFMLYMFCL